MDQRQFAAALGVKSGTLAGWETDRQKPRDLVGFARAVESITGVRAQWLLGLIDAHTHEYVARKSGPLSGSPRRSAPRSAHLMRPHGPRPEAA